MIVELKKNEKGEIPHVNEEAAKQCADRGRKEFSLCDKEAKPKPCQN